MEKILELKNITKIYPNGTIANKNINLAIRAGTIHAIVGENGAGKTTLMKILFGIEKQDVGDVFFYGKKVLIKSPKDAISAGLGMVHQHFMLAYDLTVAENVVLGIEPRKKGFFLDIKDAINLTQEISEQYGLPVPPQKKIKDLPVGIRQRVEILKALYRKAKLLILDEPTSVLTPQETEVLFRTLRQLKSGGKTIIFISHKLGEVKKIADQITVMKNGTVITTKENENVDEHELARIIVGREVSDLRVPTSCSTRGIILEVNNLCYNDEQNIPIVKNASFCVRGGEIVGVAGIDGNGQSELVELITGICRPTSGKIIINGQNTALWTPRQVRENGVGHIPQDRMKNGCAEQTSISENIIIDRYYDKGFSILKKIKWKYVYDYCNKIVRKYRIKCSSQKAVVSSLSGGNIQKVIVARELSADPLLIVAAHPTRGIDVGSGEMVHKILVRARDDGKAILLVSADLNEILRLSSRILVMYNGQIVVTFSDLKNIKEEDMGPYMLGIKREYQNHEEKDHSEIL